MHPNNFARSQGRSQRRAGLSDFGSDPFFGGGMMMGGSGFLDNFFRGDPFDDPFFTRPMGAGLFSGGGAFGRNSPFGMGMGFDSRFDCPDFLTRPDGSFIDQGPYRPPPQISQPAGRSGPIIEELTDDIEDTNAGNTQSGQHPIIEHPEDDERSGPALQHGDVSSESRNLQVLSDRYQQPSNNARQQNSTYQSYTFQSSSMSFGGSGGSFYSSSMRRVGHDGVVQEEHVEKDSSGKQTRTSARGLRDQIHAITRKRNVAAEPETTVETLRNLTPEEAPEFNARWEARAQRSLPGWSRGHAQILEGNYSGLPREAQPALHFNDDSSYMRLS